MAAKKTTSYKSGCMDARRPGLMGYGGYLTLDGEMLRIINLYVGKGRLDLIFPVITKETGLLAKLCSAKEIATSSPRNGREWVYEILGLDRVNIRCECGEYVKMEVGFKYGKRRTRQIKELPQFSGPARVATWCDFPQCLEDIVGDLKESE